MVGQNRQRDVGTYIHWIELLSKHGEPNDDALGKVFMRQLACNMTHCAIGKYIHIVKFLTNQFPNLFFFAAKLS